MSVVSTINNTENYGEHRSWIDVDGGRYGDRLCHSPHRYLSKQVPLPAVKISTAALIASIAPVSAVGATAGEGQVIKIEKL